MLSIMCETVARFWWSIILTTCSADTRDIMQPFVQQCHHEHSKRYFHRDHKSDGDVSPTYQMRLLGRSVSTVSEHSVSLPVRHIVTAAIGRHLTET
jgi:hypothetical protein